MQVARKPRQNRLRLRKLEPSSIASSRPPIGAAKAVATPAWKTIALCHDLHHRACMSSERPPVSPNMQSIACVAIHIQEGLSGSPYPSGFLGG